MKSYGTVLLIALILTGFSGCGDEQSGSFHATGIVEGTDVKVSALTGGLLLNVRVDEGQDIDSGRVIAVVDTEKLVYQKELVEANAAEINVQDKINVNSLQKAQSDFDYIDKKYRRFQDLVKKQSASEQVLDDLKRNFDAAKTQLKNAHQSLRLIKNKKKALEAQLNIVKRQISDATILSPISGTVITKYYETGETVPTGFPVVQIIDLSEMWTKVYVSEKLLPKLNVGQDAMVRIDGSETTLDGKISWISPKAEFTPKNILTEESRTSLVYAVKITVSNPEGILKHGMPVEVEFDLNE